MISILFILSCSSTNPDSGPTDLQDTSPADFAYAPCLNPQSSLDGDGNSTGYEVCENGGRNRVSDVPRPITDEQLNSFTGECESNGTVYCRDEDCTDQPIGRCDNVYSYGFYNCECVYICEDDSDCSPQHACVIGPIKTCNSATCRTNSDCESGECGLFFQGTEYSVLACRTPQDRCRSTADCESTYSCAHHFDFATCELNDHD